MKEMIGKTFVSVECHDDTLIMSADDGSKYTFIHDDDCCEHVYIESVDGDLQDLWLVPLVMAEEVSDVQPPPPTSCEYTPESYTWTFYKFATRKGYVTVRWFGQSNGYYSEDVSLKISSLAV
jgi:hypothetical protein